MNIVSFLINLTGATMLLLFAVRMVRTGIERSFGASFQRLLTQKTGVVGSSLTGLMLAVVLQSSAAVALLATGFAASGYLAFPAGLAIVLGGDLGSALIIQVLSFKLDWLVPLLLAIGGWLFVKVSHNSWRQLGRVVLGVAFILLSLRFLRHAMDPIRDSAVLPMLADYLARDFITAFLVGAVLAFVMHSSVAAILMCVTLAQIGAIPFAAALSLVLGANMGSSFIPIWLTRGMQSEARRIPYANMVLRGSWALAALLLINFLTDPSIFMVSGPGQSLVIAHIAFNLSLLLVALPFCRILETPMAKLFPLIGLKDAVADATHTSVLDNSTLENPRLAIAGLKRELLYMNDLVEQVFRPIPGLFENWNEGVANDLRERDFLMNATLSEIRSYVANMPMEKYSKTETKIVRGLIDFAIRLEAAGDVISKQLTSIAEDKRKHNVRFSSEGWMELVQMHESILANLKLAANVLVSDDIESARLLIIENTEIKSAERKSRKRHLRRLQEGRVESFESSDIHLETLRAFRDISSHISAVAYPILYRNGQLLETRLIQDMKAQSAG